MAVDKRNIFLTNTAMPEPYASESRGGKRLSYPKRN